MVVDSDGRPQSDDGLRQRLADSSSYIDNLINIVPPKFYFPADPDEVAKRFQKFTGKVQKAPKHERKLAAVERKKARLDPNQPAVTDQIGADEDDDEQMDDDDEDDDDDDEEVAQPKQLRKAKGAAKPQQRPAKPPVAAEPPPELPPPPSLNSAGRLESAVDRPPLSVDGLRERLAQRLAKMRCSRGGVMKAPGERAAEAQAKGKQKKHVAGGHNKAGGAGGSADAAEDPATAAPSPTGGARGGSSSIEFNKLAAAAAEPGKAKRKLSTATLLAQAQERERLKKARLAAPDGGGEDAQIEEWQRALQKAGGIKQRDNPTLLRKALKRKERTKKKSAKEWSTRVKTVAKTMQEKQERRKTNLAERKTKNKNRVEKGKKSRAGFEGKKNSFL